MAHGEFKNAVAHHDVEGGVGIVAGADTHGDAIHETAGVESDGAVHGGKLGLSLPQSASLEQDVPAVAVDVETVDVTVCQHSVGKVVCAENPPVTVSGHPFELSVPQVVEGEGVTTVAPTSVSGIGAVHSHITESNACRTAHVEHSIGNHLALRCRHMHIFHQLLTYEGREPRIKALSFLSYIP